MGGDGSGPSCRYNGTVDGTMSLDLVRLCRNVSGFRAALNGMEAGDWGRPFRLAWKDGDGKETASIGLTLTPDPEGRPQLRGAAFDYRRSDEPMAYRALLESTPCFFGGRRWWWRCPGRGCSRRCRALYLVGGWFVCRTCARLTYDSRREHRGTGVEDIRRAEVLWERAARARSPRRRAWLEARAEALDNRSMALFRRKLGFP